MQKTNDPVAAPRHYTRTIDLFGWEVIDVTEKLPANLSNAVKYLLRAGEKDPSKYLQDCQKSLWYLERECTNINSVDYPEDPYLYISQLATKALGPEGSVPAGVKPNEILALRLAANFCEMQIEDLEEFRDDVKAFVAEEEAKALVPPKHPNRDPQLGLENLPMELLTNPDPREWSRHWLNSAPDVSQNGFKAMNDFLALFKELCRVEGVRDGYKQGVDDSIYGREIKK